MSKAGAAISREEMVQLLVLDSVEHGSNFRRYSWLQNALERGFVGYAAMSHQELLREMRWRGLTVDPKPDEEQYEADDDHAEIQSLLPDRQWTSIAYD